VHFHGASQQIEGQRLRLSLPGDSQLNAAARRPTHTRDRLADVARINGLAVNG
jgi:hypothetical protein